MSAPKRGSRNHSGSKAIKGAGPRAGYDDKRYRAACALLRKIGGHVCAWCMTPIDLQLHWPHPLSWSADHIVPRSQLGPDDPRQWHISNLQEMHRRCNSARGDKPMPRRILQPGLDTSIDW